MAKIRIFTDTNGDLPKEIREAYQIDDLKMCVAIDGQVVPADSDWSLWSAHEFYELIKKQRVTTTQVPIEEFRTRFAACLEQGEDVIYIGCALPLSSSVNTGAVVARELLANYPEREIYCVDSKNVCNGEGMLAILAAQLRDAGKSAKEIVAAIEEKRAYVNQFVTVGSLDMLKRSGRVKGSAAFFGNLLGVKPILVSDANGQNVPVVKVKGRKASLDKLVEMMKEAVIAPEEQTVYIQHADCEADALYLKEKLMELGFANAVIGIIGPVVGACIGGGAIGIWAFGKKVEMVV